MITNDECREIQDAIRKRYRQVSRSIAGKFRYPTGQAGAEALGYAPHFIQSAPNELLELFCGVGNPFSQGDIHPDEVVLDVGCGGGFDLFCASLMIGPTGKAFGIDLTPEMAKRARENLAKAGASMTEVRVASSEKIPFDDDMFDVVISNGVLNLSPLKEASFGEIHRVLKSGGRFQFADMVLREELPAEKTVAKAWSQ